MGRYLDSGYDYRLSMVEVQKLAYFLQEAGEPLRLDYRGHFYGPYTDTLRKVLRHIEGHLTRGFGDGKNAPEDPLELLDGAREKAETYLARRPETSARIEEVASLIEGFETPFGMELLGTVHWVTRTLSDPRDLDAVVDAVHEWSPRKASTMKRGHVEAAWRRLVDKGWLPDRAAASGTG